MVTMLLHVLGGVALLAATGVVVLCVRQRLSGSAVWDIPSDANQQGHQSRGDAIGPVERTPQLILQAQALAALLRPPPPPATAPPVAVVPERPAPVEPPPVPVIESPKFRLVGTTWSERHPERSMALIAETGQEGEARWVKEGVAIGHFVIHEIR